MSFLSKDTERLGFSEARANGFSEIERKWRERVK
jgi:hypothetical protein